MPTREAIPPQIEKLARGILEGHVSGKKPGSKLPAATTLSAQMGVSRYFIRVALDRLASQNQIEIRRGAGAVVATRLVDRYKKFAGKQIGVSFGRSWLALREPFNQSVMSGIYNGLYNTGLDVLVTSQNWDQRRRESPARHFGAPIVAGIILVGRQPPKFLESIKQFKRKPMVSLDWDATEEGYPSICFDNAAGSDLLARRLHKLGHRRVVAIFESPKRAKEKRDPAWDERTQSFLSSWKKLGNPDPICLYLNNRSFFTWLKPKVCELLRQPAQHRPTAVLCMAQDPHLAKYATECGLNIPDDLTVVTFGQGKEGDPEPEMTCVRFDGQSLGSAALEYMLKLIVNPKLRRHRPHVYRIKGHFVPGGTHARV